MLTGWVENSAGNYRYFHPTSGILYVGLQKVGEDYYYFSKTTGIRYEKGFGTVGSKKYYFDKKNRQNENRLAGGGWQKILF